MKLSSFGTSWHVSRPLHPVTMIPWMNRFLPYVLMKRITFVYPVKLEVDMDLAWLEQHEVFDRIRVVMVGVYDVVLVQSIYELSNPSKCIMHRPTSEKLQMSIHVVVCVWDCTDNFLTISSLEMMEKAFLKQFFLTINHVCGK
jgi:hypothetical protein